MLRKHVELGGWYGDCDLEGNYVSLHRDSHLSVNGTKLDLPVGPWGKENLVQLVIKKFKGQILIAGQGQVGDKGSGNWLFFNNNWRLLTNSFGTFACAFDPNRDYLYLVVAPNTYKFFDLNTETFSVPISRQLGAQGIRYINFQQSPVDGIVTGDETYGPTPYTLAQWSELGKLVIGQGYNGGAICQYNDRRVLEPGDCQFLHLKGRDDQFCLPIVKMLEITTVFYWMTLDELKNFPLEIVVTPVPPTDPIPPIIIPPIPEPEPIPIPPTHEDIFKKIKELKLMDPEVVSLVCFDHYARVRNGQVVFDQISESDETEWEISKPDDRFAIRPLSDKNKFLGADSTKYGTDICKQFYLTDSRGNYESWFIGTRPSGLIEAVIEYINQGANYTVPFASAAITIKRKK